MELQFEIGGLDSRDASKQSAHSQQSHHSHNSHQSGSAYTDCTYTDGSYTGSEWSRQGSRQGSKPSAQQDPEPLPRNLLFDKVIVNPNEVEEVLTVREKPDVKSSLIFSEDPSYWRERLLADVRGGGAACPHSCAPSVVQSEPSSARRGGRASTRPAGRTRVRPSTPPLAGRAPAGAGGRPPSYQSRALRARSRGVPAGAARLRVRA